MEIIKAISTLYKAFDPVIIQCVQGSEDKAIIKIKSTHLSNEVTLESDYFNRRAQFDLSNILKNLFMDEDSLMKENEFIVKDKNLVADFTIINGYDPTDKAGPLYVINAVSQIGESSDVIEGNFRTNFERLYYYPGYDRTVSFIGFSYGYYLKSGEKLIFKDIEGKYKLLSVKIEPENLYIALSNKEHLPYLETNQGEIIKNNLGEIIYIADEKGYFEKRIPIETRPVPASPFYIRWINQQGGWDYWMFSHRQYLNRTIQNIQSYKPYFNDQQTAKKTHRIIGMEGVEKIKVGAEGLNNNEFETISKLIYSPRIEWYNEKIELGFDNNKKIKWVGIQVENGENELDSRNALQNIEFTFLLPEPQLQF